MFWDAVSSSIGVPFILRRYRVQEFRQPGFYIHSMTHLGVVFKETLRIFLFFLFGVWLGD